LIRAAYRRPDRCSVGPSGPAPALFGGSSGAPVPR